MNGEGLSDRFDEVLTELEAAAGWQTTRVRRPVLILGSLDGVLTGIRQLRRARPLETEEIAGLRVPTLAEMARIKAWPSGASVLAEVVERLGAARLVDLATVDLESYRTLEAPWNDWRHVVARGRVWARWLADLLLAERETQ